MDYQIEVKPYVDYIHVYSLVDSKKQTLPESSNKATYLGMMKPAQDYETMILNNDQTKTFSIKIPENTKQLKLELLGYGKIGGTTEYKLADVLSVPPRVVKDTSAYNSPMIVNTPHQIRDVLIRVPTEVRKLTDLPEWIRPIMIDPTTLKNTYKLQASEFAVRGIDITGRSWFAQTAIQIPEWGSENREEYLKILDNQRPLQIHCFSLTSTSIIDVDDH